MDSRLKKLTIALPSHWMNVSKENPNGPLTFINSKLEEPGVLQISWAEYIGGEKPNADYNDLLQLSKTIGLKNEFGEIKAERSGDCRFGKYAYVQFSKSDLPYTAIWHLTNGKDFIFATFICTKIPKAEETNDVKNILTTIRKKNFFF